MHYWFVLWLVFIGSFIVSTAQAKDTPVSPLPAALIGTWQVTKVDIDKGASHTPGYQINDPQLVGRMFTFTTELLTNNTPENQTCTGPSVTRTHATAAALIKDSMAGRGFPPVPTPEDFGLPLTSNTAVDYWLVKCTKEHIWGAVGQVEGIYGAWIVALSKDQLIVHWYAETILTLNRVAANAKPSPSFNCAKATTPTEKTICSSLALAAFDRSVAQSYRDAIDLMKEVKNPEGLRTIKAAQKKWLAVRNACGTDVECLQKTMRERLE
ncbi:MAG: DUF1311 domain-containing protein, partial [Gammaproteobacteria bacterium]|nr:DUF1311 domain-containing protein [Gammaproteobacteria bacterium]